MTSEQDAAELEQLRNDLAALIPVAQMYLAALDADPENEMLTLPQALGVTWVREAVERWEARQAEGVNPEEV